MKTSRKRSRRKTHKSVMRERRKSSFLFRPRVEQLEDRRLLSVGGADATLDLFHTQDALFAENAGQWANDDVYFGYNKGGTQIYFTDDSLEFGLSRTAADSATMLAESPATLQSLVTTDPFQYTTATYQTANAYLSKPVTADLNGDGYLDLLLQMSGGWQALYNQSGTGFTTGFTTGTYWGINGYPPVDIVSFDINSDSRSDLIFSSHDRIITIQSVPTESWTNRYDYIDFYGRSFGYLGTGDFNQDDRQDIVAVLGTGLQLLYGQDNGLFTWGPYLDAGFNIGRIAIGDINGDALLDVVGIHGTALAVFTGSPTEGLAYQYDHELPAPVPLADVQIADLDLDGFADVAASYKHEYSQQTQFGTVYVIESELHLLFGNQDSSLSGLQPPYSWVESSILGYDRDFPIANIIIGTLNEDSLPDIALSTEGQNGAVEARIKILHQMADGTFGNVLDIHNMSGDHTYGMSIADLNNDYAQDLIVSSRTLSSSPDLIQVLYGQNPQTSVPTAAITTTKTGRMVDSWDTAHDEFIESETYEDGIQLGALVLLPLPNQQESKPTYSFTLPNPAIGNEVYLSRIDVSITGNSNEAAGTGSGVTALIGGAAGYTYELLGDAATQTNSYDFTGGLGTDWSPLLREENGVWYLDVTLAAIEDDDWYDLKDVTVTYIYQGFSGDDLTRLDQVVRGIAQLERFHDYHTSYLIDGDLVLGMAYNAYCATAAQAIANSFLAWGATEAFGQAWGLLAGYGYSEYVKPHLNNILGWPGLTSSLAVGSWYFSEVIQGNSWQYINELTGYTNTAISGLESLASTYYAALQDGTVSAEEMSGINTVLGNADGKLDDLHIAANRVASALVLSYEGTPEAYEEAVEDAIDGYMAILHPLYAYDYTLGSSCSTNDTESYFLEYQDLLGMQVYAAPDLTVNDLHVGGETSILVTGGDAITVDYDVLNQGTASAAASAAKIVWSADTTIDVSDDQLDIEGQTGLGIGEEEHGSVSVTIPHDAAHGQIYYIGVIADYDNQIDEFYENNNAGTCRIAVTIADNLAPTADVGGPYSVDEGDTVTLSASGSDDPDGSIASYVWDIDNDGQYDDASGVTTSFSRTLDGTYTVRVKVIDDDGAFDTDSTTVTVNNVAPTAYAGGPYECNEGTQITLDASASFDPGLDIASYAWDLDNDGQYDDAVGQEVSYLPPSVGVVDISVRVTDDDGAWDTDSAQITVHETTPPIGSVSISSAEEWDGDPDTLDSPVVRIDPSATDNSGAVDSMRFSFDGVTWEGWQSYSGNVFDRTLSADFIQVCGGQVEVYVQYRDPSGNESPVYDAGLTITSAPLVVTTTDDLILIDDATSLREALLGSEVRPGSTVTFDTSLYSEGQAVITLGGSQLDINADVIIQGPGADNLTIDADGQSRVFYVNREVAATLFGLTVTGGIATRYGGGIFNYGTLTITDSYLTGNSTTAEPSALGGGIFSRGTLAISSSTISDNSALGNESEGGGIYAYGITLTISDSMITGNWAEWGGGVNSATTATITNSFVFGNSAILGGGVYNDKSTLTITNSLITGNSARYYNTSDQSHGGGIASFNGLLSIVNSTVVGNSSGIDGGGVWSAIYSEDPSPDNFFDPSSFLLVNSIVALNTASSDADFYGFLLPDSSHNLISVDTDFVCNPDDGGDGWEDNPATPGIDESANNNYGDLRLTLSSPAVDAGSNALAVDSEGNPLQTDLLGDPRIQNVIVDIGAYEFDHSPEVANLIIDNGTTQRSTIKTLQIEFSEDVFGSLAKEHLHLRNITTGEDVAAADMALITAPATLTAMWTFPSLSGSKLAEGNYVATLEAAGVRDGVGNQMQEDYVFEFHVFPGDATGDGKVNIFDLLKVRQNYLKPFGPERDDSADVNSDGNVNVFDLLMVRQNYLETLEVPFDLVVSETDLVVSEGDTAQFTVALSTQPRGTVEVAVARSSGDEDLSVQSGATLTFDDTNWGTPQPVTLAAAEDVDTIDGMAEFTVSASNARNEPVVAATESDNDQVLLTEGMGALPMANDATPLMQPTLDKIADAAITRWAAVGLSDGLLRSDEQLVLTWAVADAGHVAARNLWIDDRYIAPTYGPFGNAFAGRLGSLSAGTHEYAIEVIDRSGTASREYGKFHVAAFADLAPQQPIIPIPVLDAAFQDQDGSPLLFGLEATLEERSGKKTSSFATLADEVFGGYGE